MEQQSKKMIYKMCNKDSIHTNEPLNMVCSEPQCFVKPLACSVCLLEQHENHKIMHLKTLIRQSEKQILKQTSKPKEINLEQAKLQIEKSQSKALHKFQSLQNQVTRSLTMVKSSIISVYIKMMQQIKFSVEKIDPRDVAANIKKSETKVEELFELVRKLLSLQEQEIQLSDTIINDSVQKVTKKIEKEVELKEKKINHELSSFCSNIQSIVDRPFHVTVTLESLLNTKVSILCKSNKMYLNGGTTDGGSVYMTAGDPSKNTHLQWEIRKVNEIYVIKSISSNGYLDGRAESGQQVLATNRQPDYDSYLQWNIISAEEGDWYGFQSVSSMCYMNKRAYEDSATITDCQWKGNPDFYFRITEIE